jgi:hypothetical protein
LLKALFRVDQFYASTSKLLDICAKMARWFPVYVRSFSFAGAILSLAARSHSLVAFAVLWRWLDAPPEIHGVTRGQGWLAAIPT